MPFPILSSIREIADSYDVFLIDLWGVIHDGVHPYEGARECLQALKERGKILIFISNAPRRSLMAERSLERMEIQRIFYDAMVTSGELVFSFISRNVRGFGSRYMIVGPERDAGLLNTLNYTRVHCAQEADFLIVTGYDDDHSPEDEKLAILKEAAPLHLPLLCANPDRAIVRQNGTRALCAGVIADQYQALGGEVIFFGKPHRGIYEVAMEIAHSFRPHCAKNRVAAIGDNLETDIPGAIDFGIDNYLITGGVLSHVLADPLAQTVDARAQLERICAEHKAEPTAAMYRFVW